jgi:hypothetical protein
MARHWQRAGAELTCFLRHLFAFLDTACYAQSGGFGLGFTCNFMATISSVKWMEAVGIQLA